MLLSIASKRAIPSESVASGNGFGSLEEMFCASVRKGKVDHKSEITMVSVVAVDFVELRLDSLVDLLGIHEPMKEVVWKHGLLKVCDRATAFHSLNAALRGLRPACKKCWGDFPGGTQRSHPARLVSWMSRPGLARMRLQDRWLGELRASLADLGHSDA